MSSHPYGVNYTDVNPLNKSVGKGTGIGKGTEIDLTEYIDIVINVPKTDVEQIIA
ncbi:hypothetical protein L4C33_11855 [Vibrio makurazakiensis]|uniref:hypothetical protein n=1 Tax=Vibrio makurazakiensis TaxID=2910250 RepID=UPI003D0E7D07